MLRKVPKEEIPAFILLWVGYMALIVLIGSVGWVRGVLTLTVIATIGLLLYYLRWRKTNEPKVKYLYYAFNPVFSENSMPLGYYRLFLTGWAILPSLLTYLSLPSRIWRNYGRHLDQILGIYLFFLLTYYLFIRTVVWVYEGFRKDNIGMFKPYPNDEIISIIEGSYNGQPGYLQLTTKGNQVGLISKAKFEAVVYQFPTTEEGHRCIPRGWWVNKEGFWIDLLCINGSPDFSIQSDSTHFH